MNAVLNNLSNGLDGNFFADKFIYSANVGLIGGVLCIYNPPLISLACITITTIEMIYQVAYKAIICAFNVQDDKTKGIVMIISYLHVSSLVIIASMFLGSPLTVGSSIFLALTTQILAMLFLL